MQCDQLSDEQAMERVGRGDISALDALYARYQKRLLFYFHRMLSGDVEQAQDMLQDLFLKLVERPELYKAGRPFSTWVFSIAHNMCKNVYRAKSSARTKVIRQGADAEGAFDIEEVEADMQTAADALDHATFVAMLRVELDLLDPDAKAAFLLRYQEDFSIRDIALTLGCPEGTVKSRLFNTTRKLAERLRVFNPILHHD
jgi:RNA polymerase sigma-70 factor (ECF subfamily)